MESAKPTTIRGARRGLTFLETICAASLLALVAATVLGGINTILAGQQRHRNRLAAAELANRLMLQYLDDEDSLPSPSLPIAYGSQRFHWRMNETPVRLVPAKPEVAAERSSNSNLSLDRFKAVTMQVWLSEESGGSVVMEPGTPYFAMTRLVDPIADVTRNPDSGEALRNDPEKLRKYLEQFSTVSRPGGGRSSTPNTPSKPTGKGGSK